MPSALLVCSFLISLVSSQWTTLLDALEPVLSSAGYQFARLDGSMTKEARQSAVKRFRDTTTTNVFLLSLKCAGVGLNLTAANHCFSLDVWWNGAVEDQAFDRIYRIGQTKPVFIHRLVTSGLFRARVRLLAPMFRLSRIQSKKTS